MKKTLTFFTIFIFTIFFISGVVLIIYLPGIRAITHMAEVKIDPHFTVYLGFGGNSGVLTSNRGDHKTLVIDTKFFWGAAELNDKARILSHDTPLIVVNTHLHADHTSGNKLMRTDCIITGDYDRDEWIEVNGEEKMPCEWIENRKTLKIGGETVTLLNAGNGHTRNDLVVYFHERRVLFTGDLVYNGWYPLFHRDIGTNVDGWIKILDRLLKEFKIDIVVPGHGLIATRDCIIRMREFLASFRGAANEEKLADRLRDKYSNYFSIPYVTGFDETLEYMQGK